MQKIWAGGDTSIIIYDAVTSGRGAYFTAKTASDVSPFPASERRIKMAYSAERLAKNIKFLREKKQLTQVDLADLIGRDERLIRRLESGRYDLKVSTLVVLAAALEVSMDDLVNKTHN